MKKIVMLCSALTFGMLFEVSAWEVDAFRNPNDLKETGVDAKTSLVAVKERMSALSAVSNPEAKKMYRWLYKYWLSNTKQWSNEGSKSSFENILGFCNEAYIDTNATKEEDIDGDWTNNFNLMLSQIEKKIVSVLAEINAADEDKTQTQTEEVSQADVDVEMAKNAVDTENKKTDAVNTVTWGNKFKIDGEYIVEDATTGDPILNKKGSKRIESELLAQKQANKEEIAKTLLAQEQALETGKQTTVATLKSLRIVDKDGKMIADETSKQLYINPTADAWINYDLVNAQHEVQLATEEQRIRHELELEQVRVIENMRTAINQMENSLFGETPNINELTPFDLTYLSAVMEDAGVTVDDDFIVSLKRAWSMQALDMSESAIDERVGTHEEEDDKGKKTVVRDYGKVDSNSFKNADIASLFLSHFKGTYTMVDPAPTDENLKKFDLRAEGDIPTLLGKDTFNTTEDKLKYHLNFVARTLQEILKEKDKTAENVTPVEVGSIWFHSFRQYMLQAFREAFSLIKEKHKEDREDWLASLMPDTKTAGIITHEDDPENKDIQWASDLTPCDATKPVAAD